MVVRVARVDFFFKSVPNDWRLESRPSGQRRMGHYKNLCTNVTNPKNLLQNKNPKFTDSRI